MHLLLSLENSICYFLSFFNSWLLNFDAVLKVEQNHTMINAFQMFLDVITQQIKMAIKEIINKNFTENTTQRYVLQFDCILY
jgi:hypothetical protein